MKTYKNLHIYTHYTQKCLNHFSNTYLYTCWWTMEWRSSYYRGSQPYNDTFLHFSLHALQLLLSPSYTVLSFSIRSLTVRDWEACVLVYNDLQHINLKCMTHRHIHIHIHTHIETHTRKYKHTHTYTHTHRHTRTHILHYQQNRSHEWCRQIRLTLSWQKKLLLRSRVRHYF